MNVRSSIIRNSQEVEPTQMSMNWWKDKEIVVFPNNEILKKWSNDTGYNMDELKTIMPSERSQPLINTIPLTWNVQNMQIYRKFLGCLGLRGDDG